MGQSPFILLQMAWASVTSVILLGLFSFSLLYGLATSLLKTSGVFGRYISSQAPLLTPLFFFFLSQLDNWEAFEAYRPSLFILKCCALPLPTGHLAVMPACSSSAHRPGDRVVGRMDTATQEGRTSPERSQ